jgi:hypothetical protein
MSDDKRCHDCGAAIGEYHTWGCDWEVCPFCFGQLLSCDCIYRYFGLDASSLEDDYPTIYEEGIPHKMERIWQQALRRKGRIAFETGIELVRAEAYERGEDLNTLYSKQIQAQEQRNDVDMFI